MSCVLVDVIKILLSRWLLELMFVDVKLYLWGCCLMSEMKFVVVVILSLVDVMKMKGCVMLRLIGVRLLIYC